MFKNYFKIAFRYLLKNKVYSLVNVLGLTLGFACFILLSLFVLDELSFDTFHSDTDQIYRVVQQIEEPNGDSRNVAAVAPLVGTEAQKQFPEVESQTQLIEIGRLTVGNDPMNRDYERIWVGDDNLFQFFDFKFLQGDPQTALSQPNNLVITESVARKYFGTTDVLGKSLYTNVYEATISGVIEDFPANSHLQINTIHAEPTWARQIGQWQEWVTSNWTSNSFVTYFKMKPGFDKPQFEKKLTNLVTENYDEAIAYSSSFMLQPLEDIHLYSQDISGGMNVNAGNPLYVYMFSLVALLILAIACFNYMNLSTAAGSRRTHEVGMRKTLGAGRWQLILQFTGEALLLSVLSLMLAIMLVELALPFVNSFVGKQLVLPYDNGLLVGGLFLAVLLSGILSALYPSLILSKVSPARALKNEITVGKSSFPLRKVLVVAQFAISIIMIAATIIIYQQLNYMQQKDLGINVDNRLVVDINSGNLRSQFESIKQEFAKLSEVQNVTVSSRVPGEWKVFPIANIEHSASQTNGQVIFVGVDEGFLDTYDIKLLEGRNLRNDVADSTSVLLTESAVQQLDLENPIGEVVNVNSTVWEGDLNEQDTPYSPKVVGVIEDFHFQSLRKERRPLMLGSHRNPIHSIDYYTLEVNTADWQQTLTKLQEINTQFDPENPMEYTFLDNRFEQFYRADRQRGQLFLIFSGLIIFIACMGLFALASFSIENRIKEIGVRKVLGATVPNITWLLTSNFAGLVGIAFLISIPLTYWAAQSWLQEFAYRISVSWWIFPVAGAIALLIAVGTISFQTVRAARMNPVESLRSE